MKLKPTFGGREIRNRGLVIDSVVARMYLAVCFRWLSRV